MVKPGKPVTPNEHSVPKPGTRQVPGRMEVREMEADARFEAGVAGPFTG